MCSAAYFLVDARIHWASAIFLPRIVHDEAGLLGAAAKMPDGCAGDDFGHGHFPLALASDLPAWPLKVRVRANSPSLWPTMLSVT